MPKDLQPILTEIYNSAKTKIGKGLNKLADNIIEGDVDAAFSNVEKTAASVASGAVSAAKSGATDLAKKKLGEALPGELGDAATTMIDDMTSGGN